MSVARGVNHKSNLSAGAGGQLQIDRHGNQTGRQIESVFDCRVQQVIRLHSDCEGGVGTPAMRARLVWPYNVLLGGFIGDDER